MRRLIRSGVPPARRLLGHVESRRALLCSRIGYVGRHALRQSGCALRDSAPNRCVLPSRTPRRFPAYMPLCRDVEVSLSVHTQTGRSQLLLQLSALCWGLSYKIPCSGVISRPAASTSCRSFFITSAGIHLRSTLTVRTRLRLRTMSIGA